MEKRIYRFLLGVALLAVFFLAGCEDDPLSTADDPDTMTWVAEYLDGFDWNGPNDSIPLKVNLDSGTDWKNLLATLSYKLRFVDLDISGSAYAELKEFNPGSFKTGKEYIAKLTLPDISTGIAGGTSANTPAFMHFSKLREISGKNVETVGRYLFSGSTDSSASIIPLIVQFPALKVIGESAFYNYRRLITIDLPDSVADIGKEAFAYSGLTAITIPNGIDSIKDSVFQNCANLDSITIPDSVTSIGTAAFQGCSKLAVITIPGGVTSIGDRAFAGSALASIVIPDSITSIGDSVFLGCNRLTAVDIPDSVTDIGRAAFLSCSSLAEIIIPDGVLSIGDSAFYNCSKLDGITLPVGITHIGNYAFVNCDKLTRVDMQNADIHGIGDYAFRNCTELAAIVIPDSVTSIGQWAFAGSGLDSITIPKNVTSIKRKTFSDCSLFGITFQGKITSIEDYAFENCIWLTAITLPDSVTRIGEGAFASCASLTTVIFDSMIDEDDFSPVNSFPGDLRDKYFADDGGPGTYIAITPGSSRKWQRQN